MGGDISGVLRLDNLAEDKLEERMLSLGIARMWILFMEV